MKTDDLIRALTADAEERILPLGRALVLALLPALIISGLLYSFLLGPRPHLLDLATEPRILFKLLFPLALTVGAAATVLRLVRPCGPLRPYISVLALLGLVLAAAVGWELVETPPNLWEVRLVGRYAPFCLMSIPLLSAAPLVAAFFVMREGAPTSPPLAGAGIGFLAASIGAAIYATHCPDDSPLFLAVWYGLAIAGVTAVGAIAGARLLRW
jgi:hypothetical protein